MITTLSKRRFTNTGLLSPMTRTSAIKSIETADSIEVLSCSGLLMSGPLIVNAHGFGGRNGTYT